MLCDRHTSQQIKPVIQIDVVSTWNSAEHRHTHTLLCDWRCGGRETGVQNLSHDEAIIPKGVVQRTLEFVSVVCPLQEHKGFAHRQAERVAHHLTLA